MTWTGNICLRLSRGIQKAHGKSAVTIPLYVKCYKLDYIRPKQMFHVWLGGEQALALSEAIRYWDLSHTSQCAPQAPQATEDYQMQPNRKANADWLPDMEKQSSPTPAALSVTGMRESQGSRAGRDFQARLWTPRGWGPGREAHLLNAGGGRMGISPVGTGGAGLAWICCGSGERRGAEEDHLQPGCTDTDTDRQTVHFSEW